MKINECFFFFSLTHFLSAERAPIPRPPEMYVSMLVGLILYCIECHKVGRSHPDIVPVCLELDRTHSGPGALSTLHSKNITEQEGGTFGMFSLCHFTRYQLATKKLVCRLLGLWRIRLLG